MKKRTAVFVSALLVMAFVFAGCSNTNHSSINTFGNTTNGIYLYKDLSVDWVEFDSFEESYYDAAEFKTILESDVASYNSTAEFTPAATDSTSETSHVTAAVSVVACEKADKEIKIQLRFATAEDYAAYMKQYLQAEPSVKISVGTLASPAEGVLSATYTDTSGQEVTINAQDSSYRYLMVEGDAVLYGDGSIAAISGGTYNSSANCVTSKAGTKVIVLFKS